MTDFRDTTVNRIIYVDGNFNVTIQYVLIQFREYDETIIDIFRLQQGDLLANSTPNIITDENDRFYYNLFDKFVDINGNNMPNYCPNHNEIYYAKRDLIAVPKFAYIESTGYGTSNQSMITSFTINSPYIIYMKDTYHSSYIIKPTITSMGSNQYRVSFKIQNVPYSPGTTISFTQTMVLYKNYGCTQVVITTPITFNITNTGTPIGD